MKKLAYSIAQDAGRAVMRGRLVGGAIGATAGGALGYLPKTRYDAEAGKTVERTKGQRIAGGLAAGIGGGYFGQNIGAVASANKWTSSYKANPDFWRKNTPVDGEFKHLKTQAQAKKFNKAKARELHPDLGGSPGKNVRL